MRGQDGELNTDYLLYQPLGCVSKRKYLKQQVRVWICVRGDKNMLQNKRWRVPRRGEVSLHRADVPSSVNTEKFFLYLLQPGTGVNCSPDNAALPVWGFFPGNNFLTGCLEEHVNASGRVLLARLGEIIGSAKWREIRQQFSSYCARPQKNPKTQADCVSSASHDTLSTPRLNTRHTGTQLVGFPMQFCAKSDFIFNDKADKTQLQLISVSTESWRKSRARLSPLVI